MEINLAEILKVILRQEAMTEALETKLKEVLQENVELKKMIEQKGEEN